MVKTKPGYLTRSFRKAAIGLAAAFAMHGSEAERGSIASPVVIQSISVEISSSPLSELTLQETPIDDCSQAHKQEISLSFQRQSALLASSAPADIQVVKAYREWQKQFNDLSTECLSGKIDAVNKIVNKSTTFEYDIDQYGIEDYAPAVANIVAQPKIFGDCEDMVLQKYDALVKSGVDERRLAVLLVGTREVGYKEVNHAVLAVDTTADFSMRNCLILDNDHETNLVLPVHQADMKVFFSIRPKEGLRYVTPIKKPR